MGNRNLHSLRHASKLNLPRTGNKRDEHWRRRDSQRSEISQQEKVPHCRPERTNREPRFTGTWEEHPVRNPLPSSSMQPLLGKKVPFCTRCTARVATSIVRPLRDIHFPGICPLHAFWCTPYKRPYFDKHSPKFASDER
jgi:hypothetical protein